MIRKRLTGIPDLSLDCLPIDLNGTGGEFHSDGGFGFEVEFVTSETGEY